ncbi:hypothetical protein ACFL1B_05470 [Nanoarchaeota archaeon]
MGVRLIKLSQAVIISLFFVLLAGPISAEEDIDLLNCLCWCQIPPRSEFGCGYDTETKGWSPSCANLDNGPCICQAMGCFRTQLPTEGECYDKCYEAQNPPEPEPEPELIAEPIAEETDYPLIKERCDPECAANDANSEWDGLSLGDCECMCKDDHHVELESMHSYAKNVASHNTWCAPNNCKDLCEEQEFYKYKSGDSLSTCECACVDGAETNMYGHCRPVDDLWTFQEGDCGANTYPTEHDVLGTVCSCDYSYSNCDRNPSSGCETNIKIEKSNCGYCGNACKRAQQCYEGVCVSQEFFDAVTSVDEQRETTEWEEKRKKEEHQAILTDLQKSFLENEFEFLWGTAGDLFEEGKVPSKFFKSVSIYFDFFKKPSAHLDVRAQINEQLDAGKIDAKQAAMITQLDAVLKASSVLSGMTGRASMYQQGTLIDTATDMVINEAVRSAKYSYCRDLITLHGANPENRAEQVAVDACLNRMRSAGVFE